MNDVRLIISRRRFILVGAAVLLCTVRAVAVPQSDLAGPPPEMWRAAGSSTPGTQMEVAIPKQWRSSKTAMSFPAISRGQTNPVGSSAP